MQAFQCPVSEPAVTHHNGQLEVKLASLAEIDRALELRYQVFVEERGASISQVGIRREEDNYDRYCDHLIVIDHAAPGAPIIGTYRLLREEVANRIGGFYSASEFDLSPLLSAGKSLGGKPQLLELGRSCVHVDYRNSATITLLWRAIASYLEHHRIGFMFGCASFPGTDPQRFRDELAYLHRFHLAAEELRVRALPAHYVSMAGVDTPLDHTGHRLPALIKAYLRVGAKVGDGAFVDCQFNTVDVFMVMPVEKIVGRYGKKFGLVK